MQNLVLLPPTYLKLCTCGACMCARVGFIVFTVGAAALDTIIIVGCCCWCCCCMTTCCCCVGCASCFCAFPVSVSAPASIPPGNADSTTSATTMVSCCWITSPCVLVVVDDTSWGDGDVTVVVVEVVSPMVVAAVEMLCTFPITKLMAPSFSFVLLVTSILSSFELAALSVSVSTSVFSALPPPTVLACLNSASNGLGSSEKSPTSSQFLRNLVGVGVWSAV